MYFLVSVSILIFSPVVMNRGTLTIAPAATVAGCGHVDGRQAGREGARAMARTRGLYRKEGGQTGRRGGASIGVDCIGNA